jgi:hypothetical protein
MYIKVKEKEILNEKDVPENYFYLSLTLYFIKFIIRLFFKLGFTNHG